MTPGQSQEIKDAQGNTQKVDGEDQCGCGGGCDCNNVTDSPTGASGDRITRSLKQIKAKVSEAKEKEEVINLNPVVQTKRKRGNQVRPFNTLDSTLQGMPTVSTAFAEEAINEEVNDDWFKDGSFETSKKAAPIKYETAKKAGTVNTLEGPVKHEAGHKIITGPKGEKYPVSPEKFKDYYEDHGDGTATPKAITKKAKVADHDGVDWQALQKAYEKNAKKGKVVSGGSTITQQLAKNLFLSNERTIERKVNEAFLAVWLETRLTKNEILKLYLDRAYMGGGTFGVDGAAHFYFNKSVRDINLAEAAMLAGLFKAPTKFAPKASKLYRHCANRASKRAAAPPASKKPGIWKHSAWISSSPKAQKPVAIAARICAAPTRP